MERSKVIEKMKKAGRRKSGKKTPQLRRRRQNLALNLLILTLAVMIVLGGVLLFLFPILSSYNITRSRDGISFEIKEGIENNEPPHDVLINPDKNKQ